MAIAARDLARQHRADRAMDIADWPLDAHWLTLLERWPSLCDQLVVKRLVEMVFLPLAIVDCDPGLRRLLVQETREVYPFRLPMIDRAHHVEPVDAADHLVKGAEPELCHQLAHFVGDKEEIIDDVLGLAGEALAQYRVLRRNADWASVEMALAHHDAAGGDQRRSREPKLVGAEHGPDHHVTAGPEPAVDLHRNAAAQSIAHQCLLRLGEADLPGRAGMGQRGERARARAALEPGDRDVVGAGLADPGSHGADPDLGDEFDRNARPWIGILQIMDQLRQILDRIDVVMRRG